MVHNLPVAASGVWMLIWYLVRKWAWKDFPGEEGVSETFRARFGCKGCRDRSEAFSPDRIEHRIGAKRSPGIAVKRGI